MKLYGPTGIMQFFDSKKEFEDGVIPFAPMTYIKKKNFPDTLHLLIGYLPSGDAVLINDASILDIQKSEGVNSYKISKSGIEGYYKKVKKQVTSSNSIFREPKIGDTVMCISKRYQGCTFGELYTVKEIDKGRLAFESGAEYTYESGYFIVVDEEIKFITNDEFSGNIIASDNITTRTLNGNSITVIGNKSGVLSNGKYWPGVSTWINNASLIDEDEMRKRVIKESAKLIKRPRLEDEEIVQRAYLVPKKIQRSK